jgi:DNA polymerase-1
MATLLLVDGHAYAYRAFHAIRRLNGPDGRPTNAIFGFIKMLGRLRATVAPSHVAVIWDGG